MRKDINILRKAIGLAIHKNDIVKELHLRKILNILEEVERNINYEVQKDAWLNLNKKFINSNDVPKLPRNLRDYHIQALIRCGAIPKKDLIIGQDYYGNYRNSDKGIWNGEKFECKIFSMGQNIIEKCFHFEDDNGFALFIPIKKI